MSRVIEMDRQGAGSEHEEEGPSVTEHAPSDLFGNPGCWWWLVWVVTMAKQSQSFALLLTPRDCWQGGCESVGGGSTIGGVHILLALPRSVVSAFPPSHTTHGVYSGWV